MNLRFESPFDSTTAPVTSHLPGERPPGDWVDLGVSSFQTPIPPGSTVPVETEVDSKTIGDPVDRSHPDHCDPPGALQFDGISVEVQTSVEASTGRNQACLNLSADGALLFNTEVTAPTSPGEYTLDVAVVGTNTGEVYATDSYNFTVQGDAPEPPESPDPIRPGDPDGSDGDSPLDGLLPDLGGEFNQGLVILVLVLLLLLVIGVVI
jgi:hypothetical protein